MTSPIRATLLGILAILIWASLAVLTHLAGDVPPFQLVAMSFTIASLIGLPFILAKGGGWGLFQLPVGAWLLGIYGLFGYHLMFFIALRNAPVVEATLINYLWPLLIVLFSTLLPGRHRIGKLCWWHITGAALGFLGAALVVLGQNSEAMGEVGWMGFGAALAAALIWSSYSVLSRLFADVSTLAVALFCVATAVLAALAHLVLETTQWPTNATNWLSILLLGLGPVGGAFYLWDVGMKKGDLRLLGVFAYFVPLLSVLLLIAAGLGSSNPLIGPATLLITGGAVVASADKLSFARKSKGPSN